MSIKAKVWITIIMFSLLGVAIGMDMGITGLTGYVVGIWAASLWVFVLGRKQ
nr:hypothetical protein [Halomonas sp.]|tara:strand:- start:162 stop:317 length:156 start_codon:yes stop_codon:yes gene_type:complete